MAKTNKTYISRRYITKKILRETDEKLRQLATENKVSGVMMLKVLVDGATQPVNGVSPVQFLSDFTRDIMDADPKNWNIVINGYAAHMQSRDAIKEQSSEPGK